MGYGAAVIKWGRALSSGLLALLDDIAALAKVAAASLDDAAAQAVKAGSKAAGIVIDDTAVTPRYVVGFTSDRELPIIAKIALGSLKNKFILLLPGALILSFLAPWAIAPILMVGGAFLCMEGWHKVAELIAPHHDHGSGDDEAVSMTAQAFEDSRVASAIRTDIILSAEIMAISLASVADSPVVTQAAVLAIVGLGMTVLVYGAVALIVRADDMGAALARSRHGITRAVGRAVVTGMPGFLKALSFVGMVAMLWVGGGIVIHGLATLGLAGPEHLIQDAAAAVASLVPPLEAVIAWVTSAGLSALFGLILGALVALGVDHLGLPLWRRLRPRGTAG